MLASSVQGEKLPALNPYNISSAYYLSGSRCTVVAVESGYLKQMPVVAYGFRYRML